MYPFEIKNVRIAEPRVFANWNETAVCFNDSRLVCSKPKSADLSQYERVLYAPDCQTPVYGIQRIAQEQTQQPKQKSTQSWKEEPEIVSKNIGSWVEIR